MANLINADSNHNYFQCRGSHYKYQKEAPLGLPISRSIFKNFLQNLEGKFIKSRSKSKEFIILQDVREDSVHLTYLFHPTLTVWIQQIPVGTPHGPQRALCIITSSVTSSMEFTVFKRCRYQ